MVDNNENGYNRECPKEGLDLSLDSEEGSGDRRRGSRGRKHRRPRKMGEDDQTINTNTSPSMMNTRRGSGGGSCPGGSLEACIAACPSSERGFRVCTANCDRRCSKK